MQEAESVKIVSWKDRTAFIISALFSPFIIIPIFLVIIMSTFSGNIKDFIMFTFIAFIFSTVIPFINVFIGVKRGKITDIHVAIREERKVPFIVALTSMFMGTFILHLIGAPQEIVIIGLVFALNGIFFFIITLSWKISMHSSILAGILVSLTVLVNSWFALGFAFIPFIVWARIRRQRHNIYQGIIATVLAALGTYVLFRVFGFPAAINRQH